MMAAGMSMFFSGSETALFRLSAEEVGRLREQEGRGQMVGHLLDRPKRLLTTILFGNMVANIVFFSVSFFLVVRHGELLGRGWGTALSMLSLLFVIIFCEMLPKNIAVAYTRSFSLVSAYPLKWVERICSPFIYSLEKITDSISFIFKSHLQREPFIRGEELQMLIELSEEEGVVEEDVGEMIGEVVELSDIALREVMVPRVEMICFDIRESPEVLKTMFARHKHTLVPVYENRVDDMLGVIHAKDFLFKKEDHDLRELVQSIPFMPESATAEESLKRMREGHDRMAFVVDEYGAVEGLVTLEDVLEEIVGEIRDEYDVEEMAPVERIGENQYRVRGDLSVRDWNEAFELEPFEFSADTVGGLVMTLLDRIPSEGDSVNYRNLNIRVERMEGRRVLTAILELTDESVSPDGS
ncbi:MAG: hemolysin family protein [Planctomycetota bacterium]